MLYGPNSDKRWHGLPRYLNLGCMCFAVFTCFPFSELQHTTLCQSTIPTAKPSFAKSWHGYQKVILLPTTPHTRLSLGLSFQVLTIFPCCLLQVCKRLDDVPDSPRDSSPQVYHKLNALNFRLRKRSCKDLVFLETPQTHNHSPKPSSLLNRHRGLPGASGSRHP